MLHMHILIKDGFLSDCLSLLKLAGYSPIVVCSREFGEGNRHIIISLERVNEVAARTITAWIRACSGVKSIALNWQPTATIGFEPLVQANLPTMLRSFG